jgi:hypothetical protein
MTAKLVKIVPGLYRSAPPGVRVSDDKILNRVLRRGEHERWSAHWKDWMSCGHVRRFRTLHEVREWLKEQA